MVLPYYTHSGDWQMPQLVVGIAEHLDTMVVKTHAGMCAPATRDAAVKNLAMDYLCAGPFDQTVGTLGVRSCIATCATALKAGRIVSTGLCHDSDYEGFGHTSSFLETFLRKSSKQGAIDTVRVVCLGGLYCNKQALIEVLEAVMEDFPAVTLQQGQHVLNLGGDFEKTVSKVRLNSDQEYCARNLLPQHLFSAHSLNVILDTDGLVYYEQLGSLQPKDVEIYTKFMIRLATRIQSVAQLQEHLKKLSLETLQRLKVCIEAAHETVTVQGADVNLIQVFLQCMNDDDGNSSSSDNGNSSSSSTSSNDLEFGPMFSYNLLDDIQEAIQVKRRCARCKRRRGDADDE